VIFLLDKIIEIAMLFDFYGILLTRRQQQTIRLYYYDDLSLSEIAERLEISRQGVYDHLQKGELLLKEYENKLSLLKKYSILKDDIDRLYYFINNNIEDKEKIELLRRLDLIKKHL
jgi:uncharacterized protein